jgi:hypothetical protein
MYGMEFISNIHSGGLGLTGGIADVGSLCDSLVGIHTGQADDEILDKYDEVRRQIWHDIINPNSSENMTRLFKYSGPDEAMERDAFFGGAQQPQGTVPSNVSDGGIILAAGFDRPTDLRCARILVWTAGATIRHDEALPREHTTQEIEDLFP